MLALFGMLVGVAFGLHMGPAVGNFLPRTISVLTAIVGALIGEVALGVLSAKNVPVAAPSVLLGAVVGAVVGPLVGVRILATRSRRGPSDDISSLPTS